MRGYQSYRKQQVQGATPIGLVLLTYEALTQSLVGTRDAIESGNFQMRVEESTRAMRALLELLSTLDYEQGGEIAGNLGSLYAYMYSRLMQEQAGDLKGAVEEVLGLVQTLSEGWRGLAQKLDEQERSNHSSYQAAVA